MNGWSRRRKKIFVAMPNNGSQEVFFKEIIEPISNKAGYEILRIKTLNAGVKVLDRILQKISKCDVFLAIATGGNRNVHIEIGVALANKKTSIIISDQPNIVELFDGYAVTLIDESNDDLLRMKLSQALENTV